ncbi:ABC transporter ATP-binding protein, partial [Reinekea blandensis]
PRYDEERRRVGQFTETLQEQLNGWSTLKELKRLGAAQTKVKQQVDGIYDAAMSTTRARNVLRPAVIFGQSLSMLLTLGLGYLWFQQGALTLGLLTAAALYQLRLIDPISTLLELLDNLQSASAAYRRVLGVEPMAVYTRPSHLTPSDTALKLNHLCFRYGPEEDWTLFDLTLTVPPGEHLAIVGPSGAGKTTLGKLLAGIHIPTSGQLRLGGVDVAELLASLPDRITLLTQETHVFSGPLADDLRLSAPETSDEQLQHALIQTGAWPWVQALPDKLQEPVGAGFRTLTPAQEQQLALTRLLLKDPDIVILDEAMASLNPTQSGIMERQLDNLLKGRTVIAITHRLDSARRADRIAVLVDGRLNQLGDHDALLQVDGPYRRLWQQHEGQ